MKKFTTIIAITLLAALLFTGCDLIPLKKDFSDYGFTFTIAGEVTEKEGNKAGNATLYTKIGTLTFEKKTGLAAIGGASAQADILASVFDATVRTLENGASFFATEPNDNGSGVRTVEAYYLFQFGDAIWQIKCVTPAADYDEDAVIKVVTSAEFVTAE